MNQAFHWLSTSDPGKFPIQYLECVFRPFFIRLAIALDLYQRIQHISHRLRRICSSDEHVVVGANLQNHVVCIKDLLCKLSAGLSEVQKNTGMLVELEPEGHATDSFLEELSAVIQTIDLSRDRLMALANQISIPIFHVLTKGMLFNPMVGFIQVN